MTPRREPAWLPPPFLNLLSTTRRVVEIGAGQDFATALAVQKAAPDAQVLVTDVDPRVLRAPEPLVALIDDITNPDVASYGRADVLYAVRAPEELQPSIARLAARLGAHAVLKPLKDEWCEAPELARAKVWPGGWRHIAASSSPREPL